MINIKDFKILITGELKRYSRKEAIAIIEEAGGEIVAAVDDLPIIVKGKYANKELISNAKEIARRKNTIVEIVGEEVIDELAENNSIDSMSIAKEISNILFSNNLSYLKSNAILEIVRIEIADRHNLLG